MLFISLKSSFRSEVIQLFVLIFFIMQENVLIRKLRLISKFMTSKTEKQTITIQILPSISGSKDNQTMKFGQLIVNNIKKNIFLEKSLKNRVEKLVPDPFSKKIKLSTYMDQQKKVLYSLFLFKSKLMAIEIY